MTSLRLGEVIPVVAFVVLGAFASGKDGVTPERWSDADHAYVPFDVYGIEVSADNRFVGLEVGDPSVAGYEWNPTIARSFYVLDVQTGDHIKLGAGDYHLKAAPTGHKFLYWTPILTRHAVSLYDGLQLVRTFDVDDHSYFLWNRYSGNPMFPAHWSEGTDSFDVVGILDIVSGEVTRVPLRKPAEEFWICAATGHIYTQNTDLKPQDYFFGLDEYDINGKVIKSVDSQLADYSASCRYVFPGFGEHGPIPWGVYDAKSGERLVDYSWNHSDDRPLTVPEAWNPRYDHLLLVSTYPAEPKVDTLAILDVSRRQVVASWESPPGTPPRVWSGDGKATVTIRNGRIVFEPIDPQILNAAR